MGLLQNNHETVRLDSLSVESLEKVKKINQAVLPLSYSKSFYKGLLDPNVANFCKAAVQGDRTVGAICVALDSHGELWIMTLAVLANYRNMGVGSQLMESLLSSCKAKRITKISLHVQTSNEDAIRFYTKRFGFQQGERLKNYYPRLEPSDCFVLHKNLHGEVISESIAHCRFDKPTECQTDKNCTTDNNDKSSSCKRRKLAVVQSIVS